MSAVEYYKKETEIYLLLDICFMTENESKATVK